MTTQSAGIKPSTISRTNWFVFGMAIVLLAPWFPFIPAWQTFIHMWRVEIFASLFLLVALGYLIVISYRSKIEIDLSRQELLLVVLPMSALILWSGVSTLWSPSWKSAVHHTLVWSEYLIFYLLVRYLVDRDRNFSKFLKTIAIVLALFAVPAIIEYAGLSVIGGESTFRARFAKYGEQIATILPLILVATLGSARKRFAGGLAIVLLLWLLVYTTAGRINLLVFGSIFLVLGVLIFSTARWQKYRARFAVCLLALVLAPILLYLFSLSFGTADNPIASRLADSSGNAYSTGFRSLMNSVSLEMVRSNPVLGVGADNYGFEFNDYRRQYAALHPDDPNLTWGEVGIVGQAHNEYLQIAAELGIVGFAIFAWLLAGIALLGWKALQRVRSGRGSLYPVAAALGLAMFLVSSMVSSYSFRLVQNGFVFFFVLAVAVKMLLPRDRRTERASEEATPSARWLRPAFAAGMAVSLLLVVYSGIRLSSVIVTEQANRTNDLDSAANLYRLAMKLDDENPDVRNNFGKRYFRKDRFAEAVPLLSESIEIGRAESVDFSYLASAYYLAGDSISAEKTMRTASELYPRSTFVLARYSDLLRQNGKTDDAATPLAKAQLIDHLATNTWQTMIESGSQAAWERYFTQRDCIPVMDLRPTASIYAVLDERKVRFPEEASIFGR